MALTLYYKKSCIFFKNGQFLHTYLIYDPGALTSIISYIEFPIFTLYCIFNNIYYLLICEPKLDLTFLF